MRRLSASNRAFASRFFVPVVLGLAVFAAAAVAYVALRPLDPVRAQVVQDSLDHPWDIAFAPDGRMFVSERLGRIRVYASGEPNAELLQTIEVPEVRSIGEAGVMGMDFDPDFEALCSGVSRPSEWHVTSGASGGSYGSLTPVNCSISPALARR